MKVAKIEDLHCDAGWRVNSFLKITTDEGVVGWSEYREGYGAHSFPHAACASEGVTNDG